MSETMHTPGPWITWASPSKIPYITAGGQDLAVVFSGDPQTRAPLPAAANARLIAAAPELLDACRAAIRLLEECAGVESEVRFQLNDVIAQAILPAEEEAG